jgi:hypothetical protein
MENITVCLAPGLTESLAMRDRPGSIERQDNAAFGGQPQGYGRRIEWRQSARAAVELTCRASKRFHCGGIVADRG